MSADSTAVNATKRSSDKEYATHVGAIQYRIGEIRVGERRVSQIHIGEIGVREVRTRQIHATQVGSREVHAGKICSWANDVAIDKRDAIGQGRRRPDNPTRGDVVQNIECENTAREIGTSQVGTGQIDPINHDSRQVYPREVRTGADQVTADEIPATRQRGRSGVAARDDSGQVGT